MPTFRSSVIVSILVGLAAVFFLAVYVTRSGPDSSIVIQTPRGSIRAMVASSSAEQELGLGGRDTLPRDEGMLFPFPYPGDYGFWMKDMRFPIDIVWILSNKRVVSVTADVRPDTYPAIFYPPLAISYVLELDAGAADEFGIATDTQLVF